MSAMLDLTNETSTEVLESLDFPIQCDHGSHFKNPRHHDEGPAAFIAKVTHDCPARPDAKGTVYPCCTKWAATVNAHHDKTWVCPVCRRAELGKDMVIIVGPLDLM